MEIQKRLERALRRAGPVFLKIENQSEQHRMHTERAGKTSLETHFKVTLISPIFSGLDRLSRHRYTHDLIQKEHSDLLVAIHALSLKLLAPEDTEARRFIQES